MEFEINHQLNTASMETSSMPIKMKLNWIKIDLSSKGITGDHRMGSKFVSMIGNWSEWSEGFCVNQHLN